MGTVYEQKPYYEKVSSDRVIATIDTIKNIQTLSGVEYYEVIQAYELALKIEKADTHDEQMSGFANIIDDLTKELSSSISSISHDVENVTQIDDLDTLRSTYKRFTDVLIVKDDFKDRIFISSDELLKKSNHTDNRINATAINMLIDSGIIKMEETSGGMMMIRINFPRVSARSDST